MKPSTSTEMVIKTKINFKEYLKLLYYLTYSKGMFIWVSLFGLMNLIYSFFDIPALLSFDKTAVFRVAIGFATVFLIPFSIRRNAQKNFNSNARITEDVTYEFSTEKIKITGETFNSELGWAKTYKVRELNSWFLIYQNKQVANLIPKSCLTNDQIAELRTFFKNLKVIPVKLK